MFTRFVDRYLEYRRAGLPRGAAVRFAWMVARAVVSIRNPRPV
jgi:hypothetical protein